MNNSFHKEHDLWHQAFHGNDPNSIWQQLCRLSWNAFAFRTINEARRLAPRTPDGDLQINPLLHRLLDQCYVQSQAAGVRRLFDNYGLHGPKGVNSLKALIEDMRKHASYLTRENLLAIQVVAMDIARRRELGLEYDNEQLRAGNGVNGTLSEIDADRFERRHIEIDELCGVDSKNRNPSDRVKECIFDNLLAKLGGASTNVKNFVDKFVAHAATNESRAVVNSESLRFTSNELFAAIETLCRVANVIDRYFISGATTDFLGMIGAHNLAYLDKSLVVIDDLPKLEERIQEFSTVAQSWSNTDMSWVMSQKPGDK